MTSSNASITHLFETTSTEMSFQAQDRSNGVFISDRGRLQQNLATRQTKLQVGNKTIVRFGPCCFISVHICPCPSAYLYISIYAFVCVDRRPQVFSLTIMEMHYIGDNRQHPVHHKQWEPTLLSQMPLYRRTPNWSLGLVSLCFNDVYHLHAFLAPRDFFQRSLYQHLMCIPFVLPISTTIVASGYLPIPPFLRLSRTWRN